MQEETYRNKRGYISQSGIKEWLWKTPAKWKKLWIDGEQDIDKNEDAFDFGSVVDILLFTPDELEKRFYIGEEPKLPSAAIIVIMKAVYNCLLRQNELISEANKDNVPEAIQLFELSLETAETEGIFEQEVIASGWNSKWGLDKRLKAIKEEGQDYFNSLVQSNGRKIISSHMNLEAIEIVNILQNDHSKTYDGLVELYIKDYFVPSENVELVFQQEVFITYQGIALKGAIDIIKIDHKNKTIQVVDFKTAYSAYEFIGNAKKYGYCSQLSFYDFLLRRFYLENKLYLDYTFLRPMNLVIDVKDKVCYAYKYSIVDLSIARYGNRDFITEAHGKSHFFKIKKGWEEIIQEIAWHVDNNIWDKPRELYEKGYIELNLIND